tara:strand:+ start:172 stop:474 length:303 start_codon:yes stop_codon:yes gene_type:complete
MKKKLILCKTYVTLLNKGEISLDTDDFPEFEGLTNEEIAQKINKGEYSVDNYISQLVPSEELNEDVLNLWEYHSNQDVDFDKTYQEEAFVVVEDAAEEQE